MGYSWQEAEWSSLWCDFTVITMTKFESNRFRLLFALLFQRGSRIFLSYVGIKNAGFLKFAIDPHTYTVVGKEQMGECLISANRLLFLDWLILTIRRSSWLLFGLAITIFFVVKGIREDYPFLVTRLLLGILIHG